VRPTLEVADIVRAHGDEFRRAHAESLSVGQKRVLRAIERCRTAALGGHLERCDQCGHERNAYNSCADRHCPKCQSLARAKWLEKRQAELLDSSSTVCDAKWRQLIDSTQGDASRREILVSRHFSQSADNRSCYLQLNARS
jgi:predicted Zn-ribbon and HTH transcriptional regulator